ncbi:Transmembrane protein 205 [Seminavis robusta]|uniref:Transmembrane protein 205 n=1 Tax=Seminavis robusta TaxID=568900 RepID=A0A9N8HXT0_9STRA|nr:Transmembrane protein 205 [Seminavis robusta]|eukprot:Sro1863_g302300.1 Transmembrane protein 205 (231) ;mRNA; f:5133-5825
MSDSSKAEEPTTDGTTDSSSQTAPTMSRQLVRAAVLMAVLAVSFHLTSSTNTTTNDSNKRHMILLLHLLSFSSWFGCSIWVSFIAGIVMFQNLPRHVFGRLQAKLFPAYFLFSAVMMVVAWATAQALQWTKESWIPLGSILATILANLVFLEPKTTEVMFARHVVERRLGTGHEVGIIKPKDPKAANDPELKALSKQFGMLHGISTLMNLMALGVGCYWINFLALQIMVR